jgi:hypothetical protein
LNTSRTLTLLKWAGRRTLQRASAWNHVARRALLESRCAIHRILDRPDSATVVSHPPCMFLGHYGLAFATKRAAPGLSGVVGGSAPSAQSGLATRIPVERLSRATYSGSVVFVTSTTPPDSGAWSTRRMPSRSR